MNIPGKKQNRFQFVKAVLLSVLLLNLHRKRTFPDLGDIYVLFKKMLFSAEKLYFIQFLKPLFIFLAGLPKIITASFSCQAGFSVHDISHNLAACFNDKVQFRNKVGILTHNVNQIMFCIVGNMLIVKCFLCDMFHKSSVRRSLI